MTEEFPASGDRTSPGVRHGGARVLGASSAGLRRGAGAGREVPEEGRPVRSEAAAVR